MSSGEGQIKNDEVYRQINEKTADDPVMKSFLTEIVGYGYLRNYKSKYNTSIDKALEDKEYQP